MLSFKVRNWIQTHIKQRNLWIHLDIPVLHEYTKRNIPTYPLQINPTLCIQTSRHFYDFSSSSYHAYSHRTKTAVWLLPEDPWIDSHNASLHRSCVPLQMHFAITVLYSATFNIPDGQYIYQISAICNRRRLFKLTEVLLSSLRLVTIFFSFWKEITKATKYIAGTPFRSFSYSPWFLFAFSGIESVYLIPRR